MKLPGVLVIGRETASLLVAELRQRNFPAAWAFAASIRDLDVLRETETFEGYDAQMLSASPYGQSLRHDADTGVIGDDCVRLLRRDFQQIGDKPFRPLVFENELPLPDAADAMRKYRRSVKAFVARMGRAALVETGYPDAELPQGDMRIRRTCYRSTKRWWNPVIRTCLPLYRLAAGGVVAEPQVMVGAAKLIYMQAVADL